MKIVVFGATGATGRRVIEQAMAQGHEVTAFVHGTHTLSEGAQAARVVHGDALNPRDVEQAVVGQDAVISALGVPGNVAMPIVSEGTGNIIAAMKRAGVARLIVESAHGAGESAWEIPWPVRFVIRRLLLRNPFRDKDRMEGLVRQSGLQWTIVRPTELTNGPRTGRYRVGEHIRIGASPHISRADVADFILRELRSGDHILQAPTVTS